jgi:antitoxin VapB
MEPAIGKLFMHGRSQAVRLPAAFRLPGTRVRVTKTATGVLLEPIYDTLDEWLATLEANALPDFMAEGRPPQGDWPDPVSFD